MAQIALALVGNALLPGIGGFIGAAVGGMIDRALFAPTTTPPAIGDLSAPKLEYGAQIPRLAGTCVTTGALGWMSEKRATEVEAGGKGGGGEVVGYTYAADMILVLGQHDQEAVWKAVAITRVWRNGELVYSARAGAAPTTYAASDGTTAWDSLELMDGGPTQLPPDVYEAAVGTPDAIGWRGRNCMLLRNARFGSSTVPPVFKVEVCTVAAETMTSETGLTKLQGVITPDISCYLNGTGTITVTGTGSSVGGIVSINSNNSADGAVVEYGPSNVFGGAGLTTSITVELFADLTQVPNTTGQQFFAYTLGGAPRILAFGFGDGTVTYNDSGFGTEYTSAPGVGYGRHHYCFIYDAAGFGFYIDGVRVYFTAGDGRQALGTQATVRVGGVGYTGEPAYIASIDSFRVRWEGVYSGASFTPPSVLPPPDVCMFVGTVYTPGTVDLAALVSANCRRANIPAALLDVTPLAGIPVRGFASAGGVRAAIAQLMQVFHFGAVCDSKLRFVLRGGASVASIPYSDMGAGFESAAEEALQAEWGNDDEVPRKISLAYININADHDAGSVIGDRGTGNLQRMPTAEVGVVMTPSEAQKVADSWALDGRYAATTFKLPLTEYHAQRQATDVLTLADRQGISYRARIRAEDWTLGVHDYELVLDDASVFTQAGIATDNTTPTINVPLPAVPALILLDIPILRDADDSYGLYACVTADGSFKGCSVRRSRDGGTTYSDVGTLGNRAIAGTATLLAASTTWGWDDASTMTVTLSAGAGGTLASATKAAVEASADLNVAAVGVHGRWEIVRFASATLIAANTYLVSGLLRGQFGTDHNRANHAAGDSFVLLRSTGMIRIAGEAGDVAVQRHYKAVPNLGSEAATTAVTFTSGEQGLKPYAPVDLRIDGANLAWNRRTRYATPSLAGIQPPLGETIEQYDIEIYSGATLVETGSATAAQYTPVTTLPGKTARVWQRNSSIGRGQQAEKAL